MLGRLVRSGRACRGLHTLQCATSFCGKGTIQNHNKCFGEDATDSEVWITPGSRQGACLVTVADGVGGWRRHGIDSSFLSQGLTRELLKEFKESEQKEKELPHCQDLLTNAFTKIYDAGSVYAGGTTVCMGIFDPQSAKLEVLNLGDSGAFVIRGDKVVRRTTPEVVKMTPRQLTVLPEWADPAQFAVDLDPHEQTKSTTQNWQLRNGDLVIFGTDGFFDNVHIEDAQKAIATLSESSESTQTPTYIQSVADKLLKTAYYNSLDPQFASPFALRRLQEGEMEYWGGKPDDISLICCSVMEANFSHR